MATTVSYKGSTIATITNQTKTLTTSGKWMEGDVVITDSGSGGVDVPVFTVIYDANYGVTSLTCTKTFSQCYDLYCENKFEAILIMDESLPYGNPLNTTVNVQGMSGRRNWNVTNYPMEYVSIGSYGRPGRQICFYEDGSMTIQNPDLLKTLTATSNGTYTPSYPDLYTEVTVNVPFSTITISSSNPSGGSNGDVWIKRS